MIDWRAFRGGCAFVLLDWRGIGVFGYFEKLCK